MSVGHNDFGTLTDHVMYNCINVCFNRRDDFYSFFILSVTVTDKLM